MYIMESMFYCTLCPKRQVAEKTKMQIIC